MRKWLSYTIDILLLAVIGVLAYVQISMLVTKDGNHGVPMAFGHSFLYVSTDSMDDEPNNSIWKGNGIIIAKVNPADLKPSDPILDNDGNIIDYEKNGDVVTFYYDMIKAPDTHRIIEKNYDAATATYSFVTMGDNPVAHQGKRKEYWNQDALIGKVVHHSKGLGDLLVIASPDAAAQEKKTAWLLPVAVGTALALLAGSWVFEIVRDNRRKAKEEEAEIQAKLLASGIDLNDEAAVEEFRTKEEFKAEYRAKLEEEKEKAKKEAREIFEKEKAKARKEAMKELNKKKKGESE